MRERMRVEEREREGGRMCVRERMREAGRDEFSMLRLVGENPSGIKMHVRPCGRLVDSQDPVLDHRLDLEGQGENDRRRFDHHTNLMNNSIGSSVGRKLRRGDEKNPHETGPR